MSSEASKSIFAMISSQRRRPAEDAIARILDLVGLSFGLSIFLFVTSVSIQAL